MTTQVKCDRCGKWVEYTVLCNDAYICSECMDKQAEEWTDLWGR